MLTAKARKAEYFKAGITLGAGLLILAAFMVVLGGNWFWERYDTFDIMFASVKDLSKGRTVKYAGLDVGRVESISLDPQDPRRIRVRIGIRHDFPLYQGTTARIAQKGLVGDYYVLLELQGEPGPRLTPPGTIPAVATLDMQELAAKAGEMLEEVRPKLVEIEANITKLFTQENTDALRLALEKTPELVEDLRGAAKDFRKNWNELAGKGSKAAESLDSAFKRINTAVGLLEGETQKTLQTVRKETEAAGLLARDTRKNVNYDQESIEDILSNINTTSRELKELVRHLRARPWEVLRPPSGKVQ